MSLNVKGEPAAPKPLPRGRHKLSREDVLGSQRRRLIAAMLEQVSLRGYADTTVGDVVSAARVSRNAFYELFDDKEDCFLAASEEIGRETLASLYAQASAPTWIEALRSGLGVYLRSWTEGDRPRFARAYLVEWPAAGRRSQEQRDRAYERFAAMFEALAARARAEQPELPPLDPLAPRVVVIAMTEIVAQEVRAGRAEQLDELEPRLLFFLVKSLADDATARRAVGIGS